jgi:hypothetical protein
MNFTWDEMEIDKEIYQNGTTILMVDGLSKKTIQEFVEKISNEANKKLDWHYAAGRGIILTKRENIDDVKNILSTKDEVFFRQYFHSYILYI